MPTGPRWTTKRFRLKGNLLDEAGHVLTETVEMWMRDPVECVEELLANPLFKEQMKFAGAEVFNKNGDRVIDEIWTADWWQELQVI